MEKNCTKCGVMKDLGDFYTDSRKKDGHASECKKCDYKRHKEGSVAQKEKQRMRQRQWYEKHVDRDRKKRCEAAREWRSKNKDRNRESGKKWAAEHPDAVKKIRARVQEKRRATATGRLHDSIRASVRTSLKRGVKNGRPWESLVGYTVGQLKAHLEKQFLPGMSWENYGKWHIDHRIPVSAFNFETPEDIDFKQCWMLRNLRPLWAKDNISKLNKLDKPFQPALAMAM